MLTLCVVEDSRLSTETVVWRQCDERINKDGYRQRYVRQFLQSA